VYPDPRVVEFINEHFVPVRAHVREHADEFKRLGSKFEAQWTPTILVIDRDGAERHRIEGFLPVPDYLAQLMLGLGKSAFAHSRFEQAEEWYTRVVQAYPETEAAPEALYWAGVSRYKATNDAGALQQTARNFQERYTDTSWAKKASVWG
jgi:phage terminase large subunit-like protein